MLKLQGICPIVATPFDADGRVDGASFERLCHTLAAGGCHGLTLFGIAGEYYKLTDAERAELLGRLVDVCRSRGVPSIVSVTDQATEVAVETARRYQAAGADSLMLLPPFFLKPSAAAVEAHVRAVGAAVDIPVMLQYAPEQTGVAIPPETLAGIANDLPTVRDMKIECKPAGHYISRLLELTDGAVRVHVGNAGFNMIETFRRGAVGVMPGCSMFDVYLDIDAALRTGDLPRALDTHTALLALLNHIRQNVEMIIAFEKHILMRRGVIASDHCRLPGYALDAEDRALFEVLYERIEPRLRRLEVV
ncbi:MAG: dihydrodipicolinate synthase family protein [Planctomycetota bacterium]